MNLEFFAMFPKGTVYQSDKFEPRGSRIISLPLKKKILYHLVSKLGAGVVAFMVISFLFTVWPVVKEELNYDLDLEKTKSLGQPDYTALADAEKVIQIQKEANFYGVNSYFSIVIPKINATANIIANVDAGNRREYVEALSNGVAHAKGTYFPGQGKNIFLFSHSTDSPLNVARYNAVFFLLRKLEAGDKIIVYFADRRYEYEVVEKRITNPKDTSALTTETSEESLILMTCDPPGTTWRRLLIVAKPVRT